MISSTQKFHIKFIFYPQTPPPRKTLWCNNHQKPEWSKILHKVQLTLWRWIFCLKACKINMTCTYEWFLTSFDVSENRSKTFKRIRRCVPFVESCSFNCHSSEAVRHWVGRVLSFFSSRPNYSRTPSRPGECVPHPSLRRVFHAGASSLIVEAQPSQNMLVSCYSSKRILRGVKGLLHRDPSRVYVQSSELGPPTLSSESECGSHQDPSAGVLMVALISKWFQPAEIAAALYRGATLA